VDDRDVLPAVQAKGFDGHRHVVGVEPHRHVELEIDCGLNTRSRRSREGDRGL
jgi:hypothetical protein